MRLSNGYVSGTWCTPTRAGLLTGRYQQRFGKHGHENERDAALDLAETTLAQRLREAGYVTGVVGKWHLGSDDKYHPQRRGFHETRDAAGDIYRQSLSAICRPLQ